MIVASGVLPAPELWRGNIPVGKQSGFGELGLQGYANLWKTAAAAKAVFFNHALLSVLNRPKTGDRNGSAGLPSPLVVSNFVVVIVDGGASLVAVSLYFSGIHESA